MKTVRKTGKAQYSLELMVAVALAVVFLFIITVFHFNEYSLVTEQTDFLEAKKLVEKTAGLVSVASYTTGFYAEFFVPAEIGGYPLALDVTQNYVYAVWGNRMYSSETRILLPSDVYKIFPGWNSIKNVDGVVEFEQIT